MPLDPRTCLLAFTALYACTQRAEEGDAAPNPQSSLTPATTELASPQEPVHSQSPGRVADGPKPQSESGKPTAPLPVAVTVPEGSRPYVLYQWTRKNRNRAVPFVQAGKGLKRLPEIEYLPGGSLQLGGSEPLLSLDGQWLAYMDRKGIMARRTDDGAVRRVFEQQKGREVGLLLTSISPDSKTLLFHQHELVDMVERPPLTPEGFVPGFVRLDLDAFTSEPVRHLEGFVAWTHDGRGVFNVREEGNQSRLEVVDLVEPSNLRVLQTVDRRLEIKQPDFAGGFMAFLRGTQIVWSRLDGTALVEVTSSGGYADFQRPKLSPSGTHLAYLSGQSVAVVDLADIDGSKHVVWKCSSRCNFAWTNDMGLLLLEDEVLYSIRCGGGWVVVREGIAGFSMGGDPA